MGWTRSEDLYSTSFKMNKFVLSSYMPLMVMCILQLYTATAFGMKDDTFPGKTKRTWYYQRPRCRSEIMYDNCKRKCKCRNNGQLYDCHRVRYEFTTMTKADRKAYTRAVKIISTRSPFKDYYEKLLTSHRTLFTGQIHQFQFFLPWHRWFILKYENLLRRVDCRITVPYWDYTLTAGEPFRSPLWDKTKAGFGGNGEGSPPCVKTGPFRQTQWSLIASAGGGCLTRSFVPGLVPDAIALAQLQAMYSSADKDLRSFEMIVRSRFHDAIHFAIGGFGGTMTTRDSAAAPEFFLLHAMVDKIWADWQKKSPRHVYVPEFLYQTNKMPGTVYYSRDLLDLSKQPGCTAVSYAEPGAQWMSMLSKIRKVAAKGRSSIRQIPRAEFRRVPEKMLDLFKVSQAERNKMKEFYEQFKTTKVIDVTSLHGRDRRLGFKMDAVNKVLNGNSIDSAPRQLI